MNCKAWSGATCASASHTVGDRGGKRGSLQAGWPQAQQDQLAYPASAQGVENLEQLSRCSATEAEVETPRYRHLGVLRDLISIHEFESGETLDQVALTCQL